MTLNDDDLIALSELLPQCNIHSTLFAERVEAAINKRLIAINDQLVRVTAKMDCMARARQRVNDVTWYGGKHN